MKKFILAEKPSVAASFADALGAKKQIGYYSNEEYTISYCFGHLLSLYDAKDYDQRYAKWKIEDLPIIPAFKYKPVDTVKDQLSLIKDLLTKNKYSDLIIATDAGREGELIARLVFQHCGVSDYSAVHRFWTSSALTPEVIKETLATMKSAGFYDSLYQAGLARQHGDWLVGINFSRYFTVAYNDKFIFGRVQSPVLALIVDRYNEILNFVPVPYFKLKICCIFPPGSISEPGQSQYSFAAFYIEDTKTEFPEREKLLRVQEQIKANNTSVVREVKKERLVSNPPLLLDLTELQKIANNKYGYTAKETESIAQTLYEKNKCLSYPRTASRYLSQTNFEDFKKVLETLQKKNPELFPNINIDISDKNIFNDEAMQKAGDDHHALILMAALPDNATDKEKNVYDIVLQNMSNILKDPYIYEKTEVLHGIDDATLFVSRGRIVIQEGWKKGYQDEDEEKEEDEDSGRLPGLVEGDQLKLQDPVITEHKTKPKKQYTDATILAIMKKHSLGAPSTRYAIIEALIDHGYCFRKGKTLLPADKAFYFIKNVRNLDELKSYLDVETTEKWETMLEKQPEEFFSQLRISIQKTFGVLSSMSMERYVKNIGECPLCKKPLTEGKNYYCTGYKEGCNFSLPKILCEAKITEEDVKVLLSGKKTGVKNMVSKSGNKFKAQLHYKDGKIEFYFKDTKK